MASEIIEEEEKENDENPFLFQDKEAEKSRIREIIAYQKSLYLSSSSSSSFSSGVASTSSFSSPRKSSSLLELMKEGSSSLRRLFDMEHTSLGNYLVDYSGPPIIKPILLWGSETDDECDHNYDPWAEINEIKGAFDFRIVSQIGGLSSPDSFNHDQEDYMRKCRTRQKLYRTKSYKRLPRFSLWRCGGFKFRLKLIRRLRIIIRGRVRKL